MKTHITELDIHSIQTHAGTQPRVALDQEVIDEYKNAMNEGAVFPPIVVFEGDNGRWLADGFHRRAAALQSGLKTIRAELRPGGFREAILFSCSANTQHGLRRTNGDKRRAVLTLLNDDEWGQWSDREIARRCTVSQPFVSELRKTVTDNVISERKFKNKHGTESIMQTEKIGRASEWERVAQEAGAFRDEQRPARTPKWAEPSSVAREQDIETELCLLLEKMGGKRGDPLRLYEAFLVLSHRAAGEDVLFDELVHTLCGRSEVEVRETLLERMHCAYPDLSDVDVKRIAQEDAERREREEIEAHLAARPFGAFEECVNLFEQVGVALVTHPDRPCDAEGRIRKLFHELIERGFGVSASAPHVDAVIEEQKASLARHERQRGVGVT